MMMIMPQWRWVWCSLSAICFGFYVFSHRAICCAAEMCQFHRKIFRGFQVEVCWVLNMQPHNILGFITENVTIVLLSLIIITTIIHHHHYYHTSSSSFSPSSELSSRNSYSSPLKRSMMSILWPSSGMYCI